MVRPWRRKNCGKKITKPKIKVLIVIRTQLPTNNRCKIGGRNMAAALNCAGGALAAGVDKAAVWATSFSIVCINASASAARPCASNQRGDSGRFLRKYQTISEPIPAITNIGRQPQVGMIK